MNRIFKFSFVGNFIFLRQYNGQVTSIWKSYSSVPTTVEDDTIRQGSKPSPRARVG